MYSFKQSKGFTLIELLVIIAIIGILASVVLQSLSTTRTRAQRAKTLVSIKSAQAVATVCMDSGHNLSTPDVLNAICTGQNNWPAPIGSGWSYTDAGTCAFDGDVSDNRFMYCATDGTTILSCTESGCLVH